jgi:hypothetical protein
VHSAWDTAHRLFRLAPCQTNTRQADRYNDDAGDKGYDDDHTNDSGDNSINNDNNNNKAMETILETRPVVRQVGEY